MNTHTVILRISTVMVAALAMSWSAVAQARVVKLDGQIPTIRLCPVKCISVSGHGYKPGSKVKVLQIRGGWARLSPVLDAQKLKRSFGERVPEKPAYWVKLARTSGAAVPVPADKDAEQVAVKEKRVAKWQTRRVTLPAARPSREMASHDLALREAVSSAVATHDVASSDVAGLDVAKDSVIINALTSDRVETSRVVDAVLAKADSVKAINNANDDSVKHGSPVAVSLPANPSEQALTTDKMAQWIAANRGNVIDDAGESAAIAPLVEPDSSDVKKGAALETQIAALKAPKDETGGFDEIPQVMTSALLDKRLNVLPGMNSRVPEDTVIALRHYALGLLNSGTCRGIAGGGAGETTGTIYLVCTDDLTKTRKFSLKQEG